jgi:hypothetical protein
LIVIERFRAEPLPPTQLIVVSREVETSLKTAAGNRGLSSLSFMD